MKRSSVILCVWVLGAMWVCEEAGGATIYVGPNETHKTILAGIGAASDGDLVIVRDGIYRGSENRDIDFRRGVVVQSENGPDNCIIDCQGTPSEPHRAFSFTVGNTWPRGVQGFTIMFGYGPEVAAVGSAGGAIYGSVQNAVNIVGNRFQHNAAVSGGAIYWSGSGLLLTENIMQENDADRGGALMTSGPGSSATLYGNTIVRNFGGYGGGVYLLNCEATIGDCTFDSNSAILSGGGLFFVGSQAGTRLIVTGSQFVSNSGSGLSLDKLSLGMISDCIVSGNSSSGISVAGCSPSILRTALLNNTGGGLYAGETYPNIESSPVMTNCIIAGNTSTQGGGGVRAYRSSPWIISTTVAQNSVSGVSYGGGLYVYDNSYPCIIRNSILWGNSAQYASNGPQLALGDRSMVHVVASNVQGGSAAAYVHSTTVLSWSQDNINTDPLFADPANGDFHLKSKAGRWNPAANGGAGAWVIDTEQSPCIDAGHPISDYANEPTPNGRRINMGAYGNMAEASKSLAPQRALTVRSAPVSGITVNGSRPGVTEYAVSCEDGEAVLLSAPASAAPQAEPAGSAIGGQTDYNVLCNDGEAVQLSAPSTATLGGATFAFVQWNVNGELQPRGLAQQQIPMDADKSLEAIYVLSGDSTGDCLVNILDLIFIRGRMGQNVATGDNWQADTNGDAKINILDLIHVRGRMGQACR